MLASAEHFDVPEDAGKKVALVANFFEDRQLGAETLVWFTEWGIWPSSERQHIFYRFRASYDEVRPLWEAPAHLLASDEREELLSLVTLGVLFLWDVFVFTQGSTLAFHTSHDEWGWRSPAAAV